MTVPTRNYNPGFLTDDELVASYCVRTTEFELLVEVLRESTGRSNPHQIVIGPRGSGKTSLLLRVVAEVGRDAALASRFFPVVFAEESYEVATAGEFWLECLTNLAAQATRREDAPDLHRTVDELRAIRDDQALSDRCLGALLDFADREDKRLVLVVENVNMLFGDMADPDAGWRLRKILQTEPRVIVFASATSRFDEIDQPDRALYDLFRVRTLRPLDTNQCAVLWETVSGHRPALETVRSLEILTGGSPRLISIVARFSAGLSFRDLMTHLYDLIDDHTEYFKGHLESLPAQERRVYLALAALWKPATTREIADHARLETSTCSAQLARLGEHGVVRVAGGSARRKQYYLTERLYNIYYLLRRRRGPDRLVEALIHFMESYYSPPELKDISARMVYDAGGLGAEMRSLHRIALAGLMELPSLAEYRDELLAMMSPGFVAVSGRGSAPVDVARTTAAGVQADDDRVEPSQGNTGESAERAARELFKTTAAANVQNRAEDTVEACDEVIRRFGESETPALLERVAAALGNRGAVLGDLKRPQNALEAYDEVIRRFGKSETPALLERVATALGNKGAALGDLNRPQDALEAYDEVIRRFGKSETPALLERVATALGNRGDVLSALKRPQNALEAYDEVVRRFGKSETPALLERVAAALGNRGVVLSDLNRPQDALEACDEVIRRFGKSETPALLERVATALVNKGAVLVALNRPQDALEACDEVIRRFGESETQAILERVATALGNKGAVLVALNRPQDALEACDEVIRRFGESDSSVFSVEVNGALLWRADIEIKTRQYEKAVETAGRVINGRHRGSPEQQLRGHVILAKALLAGGDRSACEHAVEAVLALLPELGFLSREAIAALIGFSVDLGLQRMRELIQTSPSAPLLLPLTTALERELGYEPRVAREVDEVAQDIQQTLKANLTDMKALPDLEFKKLATTPGPRQYLAFDGLARRIRGNPSSWSPEEGPWAWDPLDITRAPNAIEAEWAFLKWSQRLNDVKNPKLEQDQEARLRELESHLDQDPDSLGDKYFNEIGEELRRQKGESSDFTEAQSKILQVEHGRR